MPARTLEIVWSRISKGHLLERLHPKCKRDQGQGGVRTSSVSQPAHPRQPPRQSGVAQAQKATCHLCYAAMLATTGQNNSKSPLQVAWTTQMHLHTRTLGRWPLNLAYRSAPALAPGLTPGFIPPRQQPRCPHSANSSKVQKGVSAKCFATHPGKVGTLSHASVKLARRVDELGANACKHLVRAFFTIGDTEANSQQFQHDTWLAPCQQLRILAADWLGGVPDSRALKVRLSLATPK